MTVRRLRLGLPRHITSQIAQIAIIGAIGLFVARASLTQCVLVLGGASAFVALLLKPELGLYALAVSIPFGSLVQLPLGLPIGPSELILGATLTAYIFRAFANRQDDIRWPPLVIAWILYTLVLATSLLIADNLLETSLELAKWIELIIVMLLVGNFGNRSTAQNLAMAVLIAATAEAALGLYQFVFQVGPEGFVLLGRFMRAYGTFDQPNPFAGYLGLVLPLAYGILIAELPRLKSRIRSRDWRTISLVSIATVACVVLTAGIIASWSRGALLGLFAGIAIVLIALGPRAWLAVCIAGLLVVALIPVEDFLGAGDVWGRLVEPLELLQNTDLAAVEITDANFSTVERAAHWLAAWRMFEQNPWTGKGLGQYATAYPNVAVPRWQDPLGHAHNIYLNILAENGLPGLLTYLGVLATWLVVAWRSMRSTQGWIKAIAIASLGMLGHLFAHSMVDNLFVHDMYLHIGMVLGFIVMPRLGEDTRSRLDDKSCCTNP